MPVCNNFNYPVVAPTQSFGGPSGINCGTRTGTKVEVQGGGTFTPLPFKSYLVQAAPNGFTTPSGRNLEVEGRVSGITAGWPHLAKAVAVPGPAATLGVGLYVVFGQIP